MNNQINEKDCCGGSALVVFRALKWLLMLALIIFIAVWTVNKAKEQRYIGKSAENPHTIAISGEGKVVAIPDIAKLSLGVTTQKTNVADAQKENTDKMNKLVKILKDLGVDSQDIQTTNYQINPQYNWTESRGQYITGYQVDQSVAIKVRDTSKVGDILSKTAEVGANQVGGLTFTIDDPEMVKQEAREKALKNAKEKAEALAKMADVKLGKIVSFSESSNDYMPQPYYESSMKGMGIGGGGGVAPSIEVGSNEITVYVTINYEII